MSDTKLKNVTAAAQIADRLKEQIANFDASSRAEEAGVVRDAGDGDCVDHRTCQRPGDGALEV
jgi:hypothetical protein